MKRVATEVVMVWVALLSCGGGSSSGGGEGGSGGSSSSTGSSSSGGGSSSSGGGSDAGASCPQGGGGTVTGTLNGQTVSTMGACWTAAYYQTDSGAGYGQIGLHDMQDGGLSFSVAYNAVGGGKPCTWQTGKAYALTDPCVTINMAGYASGALAWTGGAYPQMTTGSVTFSSIAMGSGQTTAFTLSSDAAVGVFVNASQSLVSAPVTGSGSASTP